MVTAAHEGYGFDAALRYYQHALIYALCYNRFSLDEVLSSHPQGTPLRPIIPECVKRGEEGQRILIALRDGWQTGGIIVRKGIVQSRANDT